MNDIKKNNKSPFFIFIVLGSVCVLLIPVVINLLFIFLKIPTASELNNSSWLSFWGTYIGSLTGGVTTLIALYFTINYYKKQEDNHRFELLEQQKQQYLPRLLVTSGSMSGPDNLGFSTVGVQLHNMSVHAVTDIRIAGVYIDFIRSEGASSTINLKISRNSNSEVLTVLCKSLQGIEYEVCYHIKFEKNKFIFSAENPKEVIL